MRSSRVQRIWLGVVDINVAYLGFSGNDDVKVIATFVEAYDSAVVISHESSDSDPSLLRGKRLGVLQGTTSEIYADRFLIKHGIDRQEVDIRYLALVAIQSAIIDGGIEAGSLWQPFIHNISTRLEERAVVFRDPEIYTGRMNLAVRRSWASNNKDTISRVIRALQRAEQFIRDNPSEAQEIVANVVNLDLAVVQQIWGQYRFMLDLDEHALLEIIREEGEWIRSTQETFMGNELPDYTRYIDGSYLE